MVEAFVKLVYAQIGQELKFISKDFDTIHEVLAQQYQALQSGNLSGLQLYGAKESGLRKIYSVNTCISQQKLDTLKVSFLFFPIAQNSYSRDVY